MDLNSTRLIIILLFILKAQSQEFKVNQKGKSIGDYARQKVADLRLLKNRLEIYRSNQSNQTTEVPIAKTFKGKWNLLTTLLLASKSEGRNGFWSKFLPSQDILKRLSKMRDNLEPHVKSYLTSKYNDFLTNLIPYSDNIGVPPFVLNSMKIPENFDPRWNYIQKLLETSTLDQFFQSLPDFKTLRNGRMKKLEISGRMIQARGDDEFISDQEPQATSKGKKKYRLPSRLQAYRKGELAGGNSERTSYGSYGSYGDQFTQSSNSYDSVYSKPFEDYYSGGKGIVDKGSSYEDNLHKGLGGKYLSTGYGETFGAGHNSYSTSKGHGQSHGQGHGLNGYLDPFSILGGLAFLTYLGLLFQQSLTTTTTMAPGRNGHEELLNSEFDFDGLSLLARANRQQRSLDESESTLDQLGIIEKGVKAVLSSETEECPLLLYCKVLKQIQGHAFFAPLRRLFETAILEQFPVEKTNLQRLVANPPHTASDCSLVYECYTEPSEQTLLKF